MNGEALETSRDVIESMNDILIHRGPDQEGYHVAPNIQLGVRRLSIQDVEGGAQPIYNEDRSVVVVLNGEIYNFKELRKDLQNRGHLFSTKSDTEVIVHLYEEKGMECVEDLNGQFAFALWDSRRQRLLVARDRVGLKPLFYTVAGGKLLFASEIKALLLHPEVRRAPDVRCLDQTFTFFMPVNPRTMFEGIFNLPPGRLLIAQNGQVQTKVYWEPSFPNLDRVPARAEEEWIERFRHELERSIRYRMIADVPVGAFVSGGIDSCVIARLAQTISGRRIDTYSIVHENRYYDESEHSDSMARALGSRHHRLVVTAKDIAESLPQLVWRVEAPSCKTSNAAYIRLYQLAKKTSTVILTGEGADEALGGYPNIRMMKVLDFCRRHPGLASAPRLMDKVLPAGSTLRVMYHEPEALAPEEEAEVRKRFGCVPVDLQRFRSMARLKRTLFSDDCLAALNGYSAEAEMADTLVNRELVRGRHFMQQAQYFEYLLKLPNYLLINPGDRAAMTHSVENRCPFLDHRFIEFCAGLPARMRVRGLKEKYILKKAFEGNIPREILARSKRPFTTFYVSSIYREQRPEWMEEMLSEAAVRRAGFFRPSAIAELRKRMLQPELPREEQVRWETPFALAVTAQLWHHQFVENFRAQGN